MRTTPLKVYIHLPKCGGTTIDANLNHHLGDRFFQDVTRDDWKALQGHAATGFEDVDVVTVHNANFPYERVLEGIEAEFITVCREPLSAAVSMYNFATSAQHTRNFDRVKDLDFWQFVAFAHKINIWAPNFQCYYLCGSRSWEEAEAFLNRHKVKLYMLADLDRVYRDLAGWPLDPALDRNRSPKKRLKTDLSETETRILKELFDVDMELWRHAMELRPATARPGAKAETGAAAPKKSAAKPSRSKSKRKPAATKKKPAGKSSVKAQNGR